MTAREVEERNCDFYSSARYWELCWSMEDARSAIWQYIAKNLELIYSEGSQPEQKETK